MPSGRFELDRDIAKITDDFKEDRFFTPELPVTKYVYEVVDYDEDNKYACAAFDFYATRDRKVYLDVMSNCLSLPGGYRLARVIQNSGGLTLTVYVFGKQLDAPPEWTFYTNVSCSETADGKATLKSADTMTFRELVKSIYPETSSPLETDWYNAVVDDLNMNSKESYNCVIDDARVFNTKWAGLMRWYEYEITIPPGERVVNTVTAPLYPTIDENTNPAFFRYIYLLSPAQNWADFGSLEVVINTPYYLIKNGYSNNADGFEKTETGYKASFDGLPEGELRFSLSTAEKPAPGFWEMSSVWIPIIFNVILVAGIVLIIAIVTTITATTRRRKK